MPQIEKPPPALAILRDSRPCKACEGEGHYAFVDCPSCYGSGIAEDLSVFIAGEIRRERAYVIASATFSLDRHPRTW